MPDLPVPTAITPVHEGLLAFAWFCSPPSADLLDLLGWIVLHSLWQAVVVAAALAVLLRTLPRRSALDVQIRYGASVIALCALPLASVATVVAVRPLPRPDVSAAVAATGSPGGGPVVARTVSEPAEGGLGGIALPIDAVRGFLRRAVIPAEPWLAWCGSAWIGGFLVAALRLVLGLSFTRRLVADAIAASDGPWQARIERWQAALGIAGRLRLVGSPRVDVPMVVGWLQPVVVWPLSAVTGMPPDQVDAILVHELAHVRRHDVFVNLLQSVIETLFFHHPAAWWISSQVRGEREHCADDLAVRVLVAGRAGSRLSYAKALVALEERRQGTMLAVASSGGRLVDRVRRLVEVEAGPRQVVRHVAPLLAGLSLILAASFVIAVPPPQEELPADANPPEDMKRIRSLSPAAAKKLLAEYRGAELPVDVPGVVGAKLRGLPLVGLEAIDPETARELVAFPGQLLALDGLRSLSPKAAAELTRFGAADPKRPNGRSSVITLDGLATLPADTAAAIAPFNGWHLSLDGLTTLAPEAAKAFATSEIQYLSFGGLKTLSPETAAGLAGFKGRVLALPGLTSLSASSARELARSTAWDAVLPAMTELSPDVAEAIASGTQRCLRPSGLADLSGETAAALGRARTRALELKGLRRLSPEAARGLAGYSGVYLMLSGLTTLDADAAAGLAGSRCGHLAFSGIESLSVEAAREIARFQGVGLSLPRLRSITAAAAAELSRSPAWDGVLGMLAELPVDVARGIAGSRSKALCLNGLKSISAGAAAALAAFEGREIQLNGLVSFSEEEAAALASYRGGLSLHGVTSLSAAAARRLADSDLKWIHMYQVNANLAKEKKLTADVAMVAAAVARSGGGVSLDGITAIDSPDAVALAGILVKGKGRLAIPNLRRLSPKTLTVLATKEEVEIPLISTLELIAEPDGSPTDDFVIPKGFEEMQERQARNRPRRR